MLQEILAQYSVPESIQERFYSNLNANLYSDTQRDIRHHLSLNGVNFEGREIPISILPTFLNQNEVDRVGVLGGAIRNTLQKILDRFLEESRSSNIHKPLHQFFEPYKKWWKLIENEKRSIDPIQLMRFDTIRTDLCAWKILETNTACPGGTIHCAKIRDAWLMTRLGHSLLKNQSHVDYEIDSKSSFVLHLVKLAQNKSQNKNPNIAVCSYRGSYLNELQSLQNEHKRLVSLGVLSGGNLLVDDIRNIHCDGGVAYIQGKPVSIIYNKIDPLMIDPSGSQAAEIQGWLNVVESEQTDFLNSLGSMYLSEAKRVLALLSDPMWWEYLELDSETQSALQELVPYTRVLPENKTSATTEKFLYDLVLNNQERFVLKADSLTRGAGVYIGKNLNNLEWETAISNTLSTHGVVQSRVETPSRVNVRLSDCTESSLQPFKDFFGIDLFYFGDRFVGPVSRSHSNLVFNVGNGGKESPTLVLQSEKL